MGWWSKVKKAVKKAVKAVVRVVKAVVRVVVRIVLEIIHRVINFVGAIIAWSREKKLRVHVVILHGANQAPLITEQQAQASINRAAAVLKSAFNVKVIGFGKPPYTTLKEEAPNGALNTECTFWGNLKLEGGEASEFYASHLAGWNVVPVSFTYPITVFVVDHVRNDGNEWRGCSAGFLVDYVVLTPTGMNDATTLAHEIGHACSLLHRDNKNNLMNHSFNRGTDATGWQKFWFRTSRHVNFY
jgi:hypothetical protein